MDTPKAERKTKRKGRRPDKITPPIHGNFRGIFTALFQPVKTAKS